MSKNSEQFIGEHLQTNLASQLTIRKLAHNGGKGGQGLVYESDNDQYYVKVWFPDDEDILVDKGEYESARRTARRRYAVFSNLGFGLYKQLCCLPLEFVEVMGRPAYIMKRAQGDEMGDGWSKLAQLPLEDRTQIACALADTVRLLHEKYVIHADIGRSNFYFDTQSLTVQILDVDGGGYWGNRPDIPHGLTGGSTFGPLPRSAEPILPMVVAKGRYLAPEVYHDPFKAWEMLWSDDQRRVQPDLWALAVLIYEILVDSKGPFPVNRYFGGDAAYRAYPRWLSEEQRQQFADLHIDPRIIDLFKEVFGSMNRTRSDCSRPSAERWRDLLLKIGGASYAQRAAALKPIMNQSPKLIPISDLHPQLHPRLLEAAGTDNASNRDKEPLTAALDTTLAKQVGETSSQVPSAALNSSPTRQEIHAYPTSVKHEAPREKSTIHLFMEALVDISYYPFIKVVGALVGIAAGALLVGSLTVIPLGLAALVITVCLLLSIAWGARLIYVDDKEMSPEYEHAVFSLVFSLILTLIAGAVAFGVTVVVIFLIGRIVALFSGS